MIVNYFRFFILIFCFFLSSPVIQADEVDNLYDKAAEKYHELLFKDTPLRQKADNWLRAIKQFQIIYQNYPNHHKAPKALFSNGMLYRCLYLWNSKEVYLDRSNITLRKLVEEFPKSELSDDAQFMIAENYELYKKNKDLAQIEYVRVLELYPEGSAAQKAQLKLNQFQSNPSITSQPDEKTVSAPQDLTIPHYGGLPEEESKVHDPVLVSKVDYWSTTDWSRMVINTKSDIRYKYQLLKKDAIHPQKRFYIDIQNAYIPNNFKRHIAANDGLITQARIAQFDKETVRIVLDLESLDKVKVFHFSLPNQYKVVIDILGTPSIPQVDEPPKTTEVTADVHKDYGDTAPGVSLSKVLGLKVKTIVIDPGHGGKDPGAIAFNTNEKDLALKMALELKKIIRKNHPDIKVLLTRSTDRFIELEARTAFANENKADLFLSIHVNASIRNQLGGVETYFLNLTTDDEALSLAAKENQTSLKSISDLQAILNDLMTNSKIQESKDLAGKIQTSLIETTGKSQYQMRDLGVKQAPFTVLIGAQMPCVLIETGFLTNRLENEFLRTAKYRSIITMGIYYGLKSYMN
ncbi:N-acetylmuramoyl-L-alanine amidase [bacterium]|nr:N-acetylmuramoyl-L-alanine amidase [bacterium]